MRLLEIAITAALVTGAVWNLAYGGNGRWALVLLFSLAFLSLLGHLAIEGAHWQMAPAYLGVAVFAGVTVLNLYQEPLFRSTLFGETLVRAGSIATFVLALLAVCSSWVLPMFRLPRPTGPYAIGTRVMHLVDESRLEDAGSAGKRELMIQIWYPAEPSHEPYASYRLPRETTFLSSYQSVLPTNSRWNAPVRKEGNTFPVLLFSPAWNGRRTQNTYLVEDLASHGFVVVGIDHTYNSDPVAFPDGRVIRAIQEKGMDFSSDSLESIEAVAEKELVKQTADTIFVLSALQAMDVDPNGVFYRRLDTENVGALGHSIGGAVAAEACRQDARIRAALDIDGSFFGELQHEGLPKPLMIIRQDFLDVTPEDFTRLGHVQRIMAAMDKNDLAAFDKFGGYLVIVHGSTHFSFTDKSIFSPMKGLSTGSAIPPRRQMFIVRAYALAFFEKTLRGKSSVLLQPGAETFPETDFQVTGLALH